MFNCPGCGASLSESRTSCLRCGRALTAESIKALPKAKTKYKEGTGILAVILFAGFTAGVFYGGYKAYNWWSVKKARENSISMKQGAVRHEKFPLLKSTVKVRAYAGKAYLWGTLFNDTDRPVDNVTIRYGCQDPLGTGASLSLGPVRPRETRPIEVWVFDANNINCHTEVDLVYVGPKLR